MVRIEQDVDFEVGSGDFEGFVGFAISRGGASGFDGDGTGRQVLRDEYGQRLRAPLGPVVDAGEDGILVVEVIVEDNDEGSVKGHILLEGTSALNGEIDFGDAVCEGDVGAIGFVGLGGPIVTDGSAVRLKRERAGDFAGGAFGGLDFRSSLGEPASGRGRNFKFFVTDSLAIEFDGEFAFVLHEDARRGGGRAFLLGGDGKNGAESDSSEEGGECNSEFHDGDIPREYCPSGARLFHDEMRLVSTRCNNAAAQDFRHDLSRLARAIDAKVGKLIGRETLGIEPAEAGLVAEERAASHGHAARKQDFNGRIEPENLDAGGAKKFRATRLGISAAAEG